MSNNPADVLDMSDEAFLEQGDVFNEELAPEDAQADDAKVADSEEAEEGQEAEADAASSADEDEADDALDAGIPASDEGADASDTEDDVAEEDPAEEKLSEGDTNYEDFHKKLTAPFRANGKEMQIDNPDDAIRLMQMGANYNRKMAAMKPALKVLKMLEKNELLDEGKLSFLIDVQKNEPGAIAKLLKDNKVDPMEFEMDQNYAASNYSVSDSEVELDTVVESLKDSPTYTRTLEIVANRWDKASKTYIADNPHLLSTLDSQVASGIYDLISTEVEKERTFGRLTGVSDLEAYQTTGDRLNQEGRFAHLGAPSSDNKSADPAVRRPTPKPQDEVNRRDKRRAASPTRSAPVKSSAPSVNVLNLSDDEFEREFDQKFL